MKNNTGIILTIVGALVLVFVLAGIFSITSNKSAGDAEELRALAVCLTESGAKFYGAFWCPHCQDQKQDFGDAIDVAPYVECSTPDGQGQVEECTEAGITNYPTWIFPGGERVTGRIALTSLAEATGCPVPTMPVEA